VFHFKLFTAAAVMDTDEECSILLELPERDPFFDKKKVKIRLFAFVFFVEEFQICQRLGEKLQQIAPFSCVKFGGSTIAQ